MKEQLTRIAKLLALRKFVRHSKGELAIKPSKKEALLVEKKKLVNQKEKIKRNTALDVLNSEDFMLDPKLRNKALEK